MRRHTGFLALTLTALAAGGLLAQEAAPVPQAPSQSSGATPQSVPDEATLGVPIYPTAQFLLSYDAGMGQRFFLFGTNVAFLDIVTYYKNVLRTKGELVFDAPPVHMFEIGRFREETMAFPPSVTVKDYTSSTSPGFANPDPKGEPPHFRTIVQIVPVSF